MLNLLIICNVQKLHTVCVCACVFHAKHEIECSKHLTIFEMAKPNTIMKNSKGPLSLWRCTYLMLFPSFQLDCFRETETWKYYFSGNSNWPLWLSKWSTNDLMDAPYWLQFAEPQSCLPSWFAQPATLSLQSWRDVPIMGLLFLQPEKKGKMERNAWVLLRKHLPLHAALFLCGNLHPGGLTQKLLQQDPFTNNVSGLLC